MKTTFSQAQRRGKHLWAAAEGAVVLSLGLAGASAQLAITEVMSSSAITRDRTNDVAEQSDWWELTNFGTNLIRLTGYFWTDTGRTPEVSACFQGLEIRPGESVIFFRARETPTEEAFREWWGECMASSIQVRSWDRPGFDAAIGDEIWLYDAQTNLVDHVTFGAARAGTTFTYDTETGVFGVYSTLGRCGTCRADTADDIGSPGTTCGLVPLRIVEQPVSLEVDAGMDATLSVLAVGLPRPKYQWFFNGDTIPGATSSHYRIASAQPSDTGEYRVVVSNGLDSIVSSPALLVVATNPRAPELCSKLNDVERFENETAVFDVCVRAYPQPRFQWQSNGVDIVGAINRLLILPNVSLAASGTVIQLNAWNTFGSTNASCRLLVEPFPKLEITEVFPAPSLCETILPRGNWWELTNFGTNAVKLYGFRHSDRPNWDGARVVTNYTVRRLGANRSVTVYPVLQPGESAIFADSVTREDFVRWWGQSNLPPRLQVITYGGYGLSAWSDAIHVWSAGGSLLAGVSYASDTAYPLVPPVIRCESGCETSLCGHPIYGHSLWFSTNNDCAVFGQGSEADVNGAFRAAVCDDVGSPGFARNPVFLPARWDGPTATLWCRVIQGKQYRLKAADGFAERVADTVWTDLGTYTAQGSTLSITETPEPAAWHRLYRLLELP